MMMKTDADRCREATVEGIARNGETGFRLIFAVDSENLHVRLSEEGCL